MHAKQRNGGYYMENKIKNAKILIVDDDPSIREVLSIQLKSKGHSVDQAVNGLNAVEKIKEQNDFDLIILDIMMPKLSGVDACKEIRKFTNIPVLFLTAKSQETDKSVAYENGGDDYLVKPFSTAELFMKVDSLLRRYFIYKGKNENPSSDNSEILIADLSVNPSNKTVKRQGIKISLTDTEFDILMLLIKNKDKPVDAQEIYETVWGQKFMQSSVNTVMVHILNLRRKLNFDNDEAEVIKTVWGKGYQLNGC